MKNFVIIILVLVVVAAIFVAFLLFKKSEQICFNNNCFNIEIADNFASREIGLMFRKNLAENSGMLFIFPEEDIYSFWMKNTLIPLDIIWLSKDKEIVFIAENTQPKNFEKITPDKPAKYVLEINAGLSKSLGIKIGDNMEVSATY